MVLSLFTTGIKLSMTQQNLTNCMIIIIADQPMITINTTNRVKKSGHGI